MKFKLMTDKGTFISVNEQELHSLHLMLSLSHNLVNSLYKGNVDSYTDDVKGLMAVLNQMFFEATQKPLKPDRVEPLTEEEADAIMESNNYISLISVESTEKKTVQVKDNVISFDFSRKD